MACHRSIVLIVEDERLVSMLYEDIVIDAGLSVGGAFASCESAEEWLSIHSPDVAIIDIKLQDGNSAELAKKLCGRKVPFLVVSAIPPRRGESMRFSNPHPGLHEAGRHQR